MTTNVQIYCPLVASWRVEVEVQDKGKEPVLEFTLKPGEQYTTYITDTRSVLVREVPIPPTQKEPSP